MIHNILIRKEDVSLSVTPLFVPVSQPWCRLITTIYNYFVVTNFFWMFVEGCYLHTAIVMTYSTDKLRKWVFLFIGWCEYDALCLSHPGMLRCTWNDKLDVDVRKFKFPFAHLFLLKNYYEQGFFGLWLHCPIFQDDSIRTPLTWHE